MNTSIVSGWLLPQRTHDRARALGAREDALEIAKHLTDAPPVALTALLEVAAGVGHALLQALLNAVARA